MAEVSSAPGTQRGLLAVVLVFALGIVFGAALTVVLLRVVSGPLVGRRATFERAGPRAIARMTRELDLDADQQERVRAIVERTHEDVGRVLEGTRGEIRALLRPDQQERFDRMRMLRPGGRLGSRRGASPGER